MLEGDLLGDVYLTLESIIKKNEKPTRRRKEQN